MECSADLQMFRKNMGKKKRKGNIEIVIMLSLLHALSRVFPRSHLFSYTFYHVQPPGLGFSSFTPISFYFFVYLCVCGGCVCVCVLIDLVDLILKTKNKQRKQNIM